MDESISPKAIQAYLSIVDKGRTWDFIERIRSRMKTVTGRRDPSVEKYAKMLPKLAEGLASRLAVEREPVLGGAVMPQQVFARSDGLLPVFVWHAERMMASVFGEGNNPDFSAPISMCSRYRESDKSLTGYDLSLSGVPPFASVTLCFLAEGFHDAWSNLPAPGSNANAVALDDLVQLFRKDLSQRFERERSMGLAQNQTNATPRI